MINKNTRVKVYWSDASVFSPKRQDVSLSKMETVGSVEEDHENYLIIKNPITINSLTKKKHPEGAPTFYFIPKALIEKIEELT
jgi:hypothetical protein